MESWQRALAGPTVVLPGWMIQGSAADLRPSQSSCTWPTPRTVLPRQPHSTPPMDTKPVV